MMPVNVSLTAAEIALITLLIRQARAAGITAAANRVAVRLLAKLDHAPGD